MKHLPRRTFLRGIGTSIALPLLDSMIPAFASTAKAGPPPCRVLFMYAPTGMMPKDWYPETDGRDFEFRRIMKPLEQFRKDVLVLSGLGDTNGRALGDGPGDHARAASSYLTGTHPRKTEGANIHCGVSADQVIARETGRQTRFPSLEVTCEDSRQAGECDSYSCAYQSISWRTPTQPLPPEMNPRLLFERLFGDLDLGGSPAERASQAAYRNSILDLAYEDTQRLQGTLGPKDRRKLDEYLTSIRELELSIAKAEKDRHQIPTGLDKPAGIPPVFADHAHLILDLLTIAFRTDMTRVATFMLAREGGLRTYPEIGVPEAHHSISHHRGNPELIEKVTKIQCYHLEQMAYMARKLQNTPDGDGSLLDHSILVYGASMGDPNIHDHGKCPTVIVGHGNGKIGTGRHIRYEQETPICNLYLSMFDFLGIPDAQFGDATAKLEIAS